MKIYDISQELLTSNVYPGDMAPERVLISDMTKGAFCNISELHMNAHNGTHMDAPRHFIKDGRTIDELEPELFIGKCSVVSCEGEISAGLLRSIAHERLLLRGNCLLGEDSASILSQCGVRLVGTESQSIAPINAPMKIHRIVLGQNIAVLEGLVLDNVPDGEYFLFAAPIKIGGGDGSPCRAVLIDFADTEN